MQQPGRARPAVAVVFAGNGVLFGSWAVRIPAIKADLGLSDAALGAALLVPALGALLAMPAVGALISRVGSRTSVLVTGLAFCLVPGLVGLAPSLPWLVPALLLFGVSYGGLDVAMNAQAVTVERALGRPVMSSFHAAFSAGGLLGAAAGALAAAADVPVALHLAGTAAVLGLVALPLLPALLPEERHPEPGPLLAWPRGRLLPLALIALAVLLSEGAVADWSAVYLRQELGAAPGPAALGFTAFSVAMVAGRLAGDRVVARAGQVRTVRWSAALAAAGGLLVVLGGTPAVVVPGFAALGLGLACVVPLVFGAAAAGGADAGPALAAVATPGYLGFLLGPPVVGGLAEVVGLGTALALLPLLMVGVLVLAGRVEPARGNRG